MSLYERTLERQVLGELEQRLWCMDKVGIYSMTSMDGSIMLSISLLSGDQIAAEAQIGFESQVVADARRAHADLHQKIVDSVDEMQDLHLDYLFEEAVSLSPLLG